MTADAAAGLVAMASPWPPVLARSIGGELGDF
jgi:hypothetical protein